MANRNSNQAKARFTQEELEARRQLNAEKRRKFEILLEEKFLNKYEVDNKAVLTKNRKAGILRTMYVIGNDLQMQIENLQGSEGNLLNIKQNHLNSLLAAMRALGAVISEGEFTDRYEDKSELYDLFRS